MHATTVVLLAACSSAVLGTNIFSSEPVLAPTCPGSTCPAGFTGRYCDQVMCDSKGSVPPPSGSGGYGIDMVPMASCAATIPVPVDSHVTQLFLTVDGADYTARPSIVLKMASGTVMQPTQTIINNNKTIGYMYQSPMAGYMYATVAASTGCLYSADAMTTFSAAVGFTYGQRATHLDMPSSQLSEFQLATMVVAFRNLPQPGNSHKAEVYAQDQLQASYRVEHRYGCAYYDFVGPISCDSNKNWYFKLHGIDENGFSFMRTSVFPCVGGSPMTTTATPMTTTVAPNKCLHGGVVDPKTGNCVCEFDWSGPTCATAICFNGGTPMTDGTVCKCKQGYGGFHCDATICSSKNPSTPYTGTQMTLGIIIQATTSMSSVIKGLQQYVPELIETFNQQHPQYIKRYMIVSYDDMGATVLSTAHDPLITIGHIEQLKLKGGTVSCKKMLNQAISKALFINSNTTFPKFSSTYVFTDSPVNLDSAHDSLAAIGSLENTKNKLSIFYTPSAACAPKTDAGVQRLFDLAEFTGGQVYYTKASSTAVGFQLSNVMTTSYLNARAFDRYDARCDVRRTAYVPIDSLTAAFTFSVAGNSPSVVVQDPTGKLWPTVPIVDDAYVQVQQAVSPCPTGWNQFDNLCFMASETRPLGWNEAQTTCRQAGGTLANVMNAQKQAFLDRETNGIDYLIGLNDQRFHGTYVWDSMADPAIPLLAASYRNWNANGPVTGSKYCVAVKHNPSVANGAGKWFKVDCNTPMSYICQKPALNFYNNQLPKGIWKIDYQTRPGGAWNSSCLAKVDVQSTLQANWAYTTAANGAFNDMGVAEPYAKSTNNRVIASVTGLGEDSYVAQVQLFGQGSGPLVYSSPLHHRIGCLFNHYSNEFACPKNAFGLEFSGHDGKGYTFTRQGYGVCIGAPGELTEDMIKGVYPMKF